MRQAGGLFRAILSLQLAIRIAKPATSDYLVKIGIYASMFGCAPVRVQRIMHRATEGAAVCVVECPPRAAVVMRLEGLLRAAQQQSHDK